MARPSKLTPALQKKIVGLIRDGNFAAQAAAACGISESTYYNWTKAGRSAEAKQQEGLKLTTVEKRNLEFLEAIRVAEAQAEADAVQIVQAAARTGTYQAAQWFLERKHGSRWAKKDVHQVETTIKEAEAKPKKTQEELLEELQKLEQEAR